MLDVIDVLAERYGWAYEAVWQLPFCETIPLVKRAKRGKLEDYSMQIAIAHNPHGKKPKELPQRIEAEIKKLSTKPRDDRAETNWAERLGLIDKKIKER